MPVINTYPLMTVPLTGAETFVGTQAGQTRIATAAMLGAFVTLTPSGDTTGVTDTANLAALVATPNTMVQGELGATYYLKNGVSCAAGVYLKNFIFCLVVGAGGFSSKELNTNRYATSQVALLWQAVNGGGAQNVEFYGSLSPANGGEYCVMPIAVNGGATTEPFYFDRINIHDLTLQTGGVIINSVGFGGLVMGLITIENCGTFQGSAWWTRNGSAASIVGATGIAIDSDMIANVPSSRWVIGTIIGRNVFQGPVPYAQFDDQTSLYIAGGTGVNSNGGYFGLIDSDGVGQPLDCQQSNVQWGMLTHKNSTIGPKIGHGAQNCGGPVHVESSGQWGFNIYGGNGTNSDTAYNNVGPITGFGASEKVQLSGNIVSATNNTATLPVSAVQVDNFYRASEAVIVITGGTGSGQEATITGYVGATRVATIFGSGGGGNWTVNPDATSTFNIYYIANRVTALYSGDSATAIVRDNKMLIGPVQNLGHRKWDMYSNLFQATSVNNTASLEADCGGTLQTANVANFPTAHLVPGSALRAFTQVGLTGTQTIIDPGTGVTVTMAFASPVADTYQRTGVTNPQCDTANNGIRVLTSGVKHWKASVKFGSSGNAPGSGATIRLFINRNGTPVFERSIISGTQNDEQMITIEGDLYHEEIWFGANANLYTATLFYFFTGGDTITALAGINTFLSVSD